MLHVKKVTYSGDLITKFLNNRSIRKSQMISLTFLACQHNGGLNNGPFDGGTFLDHSNTELVRYLDHHCIYVLYIED